MIIFYFGGIIIVIIGIGGVVWFMKNKKINYDINDQNPKDWGNSKSVKRLLEKSLEEGTKFIESLMSSNDFNNGDNDLERDDLKRTPPDKSKENLVNRRAGKKKNSPEDDKLIKQVNEIYNQNSEKLGETELPTAYEILKAEAEGKQASNMYYVMRDITKICFEKLGIRDILQSIVDLTEYVPEGLRKYNEERNVLPLHVSVWNTSLETLNRKYNTLTSKRDELIQLINKSNEPSEEEVNEFISTIRSKIDAAKATKKRSEWENARISYLSGKIMADESIRNYSGSVTTEKRENVLSLFDDLKELLNSEEFTSLEKYELCEGDSVCIDTEIYLDASTKAYYDKVVEFADKAQEVLNKWNNKFES